LDDTLHLYVLNVRAPLLDDFYICDECDADGVPDLMRSSGKHTEEHLLRCLAPEKTDDPDEASTEQRLTSIEGCLDGVQTRLDYLISRMGDLTGDKTLLVACEIPLAAWEILPATVEILQ
jgi:hypothetical protein